MRRETDAAERGDDPSETADSDGKRWVDAQLLSDLFVNAVPIAILVAFVAAFALRSPGGGESDPLLLFHAALIGGIVLVSVVAGRVIRREDGPLEGSAGDSLDGEGED
jgi:hypothetical protein